MPRIDKLHCTETRFMDLIDKQSAHMERQMTEEHAIGTFTKICDE